MSTSTEDLIAAADVARKRWRLDPARSRVEFRARTFWGLMTVRGEFSRYEGTMDLSAVPAIELTIQADSIDTRNEKRDKHLRSGDFFNAEHHPYVRFVSESVELVGEQLQVRGHLHAAGERVPLDLQAQVRRSDGEVEITASTEADHRRLGMTFSPLGMLRGASTLIVHGQLVPAED